MNTNLFDDFVNQQASSGKEADVNWVERLEEWKRHLASFYKQVELFLTKYVTEKKIELRYVKKQMHEEQLGPYEVDTLIVLLGNNQVQFNPIGTVLIGAKGRVDMTGPRGTVRFVLVDKDSSAPNISVRVVIQGQKSQPEPQIKKEIVWVWKISTPPPAIKYIELQQESFYNAMMAVVNG